MKSIPLDALSNKRFIRHFWADVDDADENGCREWLDLKNDDGYGYEYIEARYTETPGRFYAHRIAYVLTYGPIPDETPIVLHTCDNPPCCEPTHLFLGTDADNVADRDRKGRGGGYKRFGDNNGSRTHRETKPYGENHWRVFLSDEQVLQMREDKKNGMSLKAIAEKYKVKVSFVHSIVYRQSRTYI
jgi:hypothetical protein